MFIFPSSSHGHPAAATATTPGWDSQIFLGITSIMYNACECLGVVHSKVAGDAATIGPGPRFLHVSRVRSRTNSVSADICGT